MTLMNFFHDASHVAVWLLLAAMFQDSGNPLPAGAALALAALTTLWTGVNLSRRISIREKREREES